MEVFADDDYRLYNLKHDRFGLLSSANSGPNTNTRHFYSRRPGTTFGHALHDFWQVVAGDDIVWAINALDKTEHDQA